MKQFLAFLLFLNFGLSQSVVTIQDSEIEINENAEPEIAFEVIELLPKVGMILTSTAGKDEGTFIFLVLCNNKESLKMLDDVKIKYKEYT